MSNRAFIYISIMLVSFLAAVVMMTPREVTTIYLPTENMEDATSLLPSDKEVASKAIERMNSRNDQVKTLSFSDIDIRLIQGGKSVKLSGFMVFERNRKFRMVQNSILGKEVDIGSDEDRFWFWSKRMKPPSLYYAPHEKAHTTGLRAPFDPSWITEILGMKDIDPNAEIIEHQDKWFVIEDRVGTNGKPISKVTLINKSKEYAIGHYMFDQTGKILISAEIKSFHTMGQSVVPREMDIIWFSEGVQVNWKMHNMKHNVPIDASNWRMPSIRDRINLEDRVPTYQAFSPKPVGAYARSLSVPW